MGGQVSKDTLEEIRAGCDIADIIGSYIPLRQAGTALKAHCPFHKEKTPSFNVNRQRQTYHCFGCGEGGDVFSFVMKIDGLDFMGAVRLLAQRAGVELKLEDGQDTGAGAARERIFKVNEKARELFRTLLLDEKYGAPARAFLSQRDISEPIAEKYGIGYAPDQKGILFKWATKSKLPIEWLDEAGLTSLSENGDRYERFRGRVMFPILDEQGRTVGFSGRIIEKNDKVGKYVNSPETAVFKKSRILYGLHFSRKEILEKRMAVICEGQIDTIRCLENGITNAVAPQGTALTADHARILKRYADAVTLALDSDSAGREAAVRSGRELIAAGLSVVVAGVPAPDDPDSYIRREGGGAFQTRLDEARPLIEFQHGLLLEGNDPDTEVGLLRMSRQLLETVNAADSSAQQEILLRQAASCLGLDPATLRADLQKLKRTGARQAAAQGTIPEQTPARTPIQLPREEELLVELLLENPEGADLASQYLPIGLVTNIHARQLARILLEHRGSPPGGLAAFLGREDGDLLNLSSRLSTNPRRTGREISAVEGLKPVIQALWKRELERRRDKLREESRTAGEGGKEDLLLEIHTLTLDLKKLSGSWGQAVQVMEIQ